MHACADMYCTDELPNQRRRANHVCTTCEPCMLRHWVHVQMLLHMLVCARGQYWACSSVYTPIACMHAQLLTLCLMWCSKRCCAVQGYGLRYDRRSWPATSQIVHLVCSVRHAHKREGKVTRVKKQIRWSGDSREISCVWWWSTSVYVQTCGMCERLHWIRSVPTGVSTICVRLSRSTSMHTYWCLTSHASFHPCVQCLLAEYTLRTSLPSYHVIWCIINRFCKYSAVSYIHSHTHTKMTRPHQQPPAQLFGLRPLRPHLCQLQLEMAV